VIPTAGVSSTYSGETLSLAAAKAVVNVYRTQGVVEHLWARGKQLMDGMNELFTRHGLDCKVVGCPACPSIGVHAADPLARGRTQEALWRAAYRHGVSLYHVSYPNFSHTESDIAEALDRLDRAMAEVAQGR